VARHDAAPASGVRNQTRRHRQEEEYMFKRILFSTLAAAALLTAAPAFAADKGASKQPCSCCSDGSVHSTDHHVREAQQKNAASENRYGNGEAPQFTDAG
jgi:hypothetical protein